MVFRYRFIQKLLENVEKLTNAKLKGYFYSVDTESVINFYGLLKCY